MRNTTRCGARIIFDSVAEQIEDALLAQVHKHRLDAIVLVTQNINGERGLNGVRMFFRSGIAGIRYAVAQGGFATTRAGCATRLCPLRMEFPPELARCCRQQRLRVKHVKTHEHPVAGRKSC